jgi:hypothetical protein
MKTYYNNMLNEENTALCFKSFKNGDGIQKRLASRLSNSLSNQAFLPWWSACKQFHHLFAVHEASCSKVQNLSWPISIGERSVYLIRPAVKHQYEDTGECTKASTKTSQWENDICMYMKLSQWPISTMWPQLLVLCGGGIEELRHKAAYGARW